MGASGGIIEAAICYTGDISDPHRQPYTLDYYLNFARQLEALGIHVLAIKDMVRTTPRTSTLNRGATCRHHHTAYSRES